MFFTRASGCVVCLLLPAAALLSQSQTAKRTPTKQAALAAEIAAARREGLPLTPKELQRSLPPDQNAAPLYKKLQDVLKAAPVTQDEWRALGKLHGRQKPAADEIDQARAILARHTDVSDLIHAAAQKPYCTLIPDWSVSPVDLASNLFPEFSGVRSHARWLAAESAILLYKGKPMEAVQTMALGFALGRHVGSDQTIINYLVARAVDAITLAGMERILQAAGADSAVVQAVADAVQANRPQYRLGHYLKGELVQSLRFREDVRKAGFDSLKEFDSPGYRHMRKKYGYPADAKQAMNRFIEANSIHIIRLYRRAIQVGDRPFPEARARLAAISAEYENSKDSDRMLASITAGNLPQFAAIKARGAAHYKVLRAACAVLAFKAKNGSLPSLLDQAMSPPPVDPFDLRPIRYRREGEGFVVYSVGPDGKFDGGKPGAKRDGRQHLFRYPT
jgi:hypothetical protein